MNIVICTLFENHYHYGLAALINSLDHHGFRGSVYAGFKGPLPSWSSDAKENVSLKWNGARTYEVKENLHIHFLPLDTSYHLTNYKPYFMLQLKEGPAIDANGIAYFDPDIVIKCKWEFYEDWIMRGVAVVHEIAGNPMPATHPRRLGWEDVINKMGKQKRRCLNYYFNAGFCGVSEKNIEFIQSWADVISVATKQYGFDPRKFFSSLDRTHLFNIIDQDAFNITAMCSESPLSEVGADGMDFVPGGWIMSHAIGSPKPWKKPFIRMALKGQSPTTADREFWSIADGTIKNFNGSYIRWKKRSIAIAGFISRFYSRR